jgi:hypothetical protein
MSLQSHACIDSNLPTGDQYVAPNVLYEKDVEGGYIWGNHPKFNSELLRELKDTVRTRKNAFAYSVKDLVGYSGIEGSFRITLN